MLLMELSVVAVASGLTPALLRQPAALQAQVRQALASARWWDSLLLARADGVLLLRLDGDIQSLLARRQGLADGGGRHRQRGQGQGADCTVTRSF